LCIRILYGGSSRTVNAASASCVSFIASIPITGYHEDQKSMTYKLDGAKFPSLEEPADALYPLYAGKMSEEEFRKYAEEQAEKN
jgi:hypothetical protein